MRYVSMFSILMLVALPIYAKGKGKGKESRGTPCQKLTACLDLVSKLTNKTYLYSDKLKGIVNSTPNFKLTETNADAFISNVLFNNGFTRVPDSAADYKVISARDVRYTPTPIINLKKDELPKNHDYIMAVIELKHGSRSSEITRSFRPFMSRYGRIIDIKGPGMIVIQDSAFNIERVRKLISYIDTKPTTEEVENQQKLKLHRQEIEKLKAKNCGGIEKKLTKLENKILHKK